MIRDRKARHADRMVVTNGRKGAGSSLPTFSHALPASSQSPRAANESPGTRNDEARLATRRPAL